MRHRTNRAEADDRIADALDRLREELAVVRQVLDEICGELKWANRNRSEGGAPMDRSDRLSAVPLPANHHNPDTEPRVNPRSVADVPAERHVRPASNPSRLF